MHIYIYECPIALQALTDNAPFLSKPLSAWGICAMLSKAATSCRKLWKSYENAAKISEKIRQAIQKVLFSAKRLFRCPRGRLLIANGLPLNEALGNCCSNKRKQATAAERLHSATLYHVWIVYNKGWLVGLPRRYVLYLSTCPLDEAIGNPGLTTVLGCMIGYRCGTPMSHPHALRSLKQAAGATSAATAASSSS